VVAGRDPIRTHARRCLAQRRPARGTRTSLEISAQSDTKRRPSERDIERAGEGVNAVELGRPFGTKPVIHAVREETEGELRTQPREDVQQGH
jgi:hypothetical protein